MTTALLRFRQGGNIGPAGTALVVDDSSSVTIENSDNTGVESWRIELLYAPPGAAIEPVRGVPHVLAEQAGSTPVFVFTPTIGVRGSYRFRLTTDGPSGVNQDIRNITVPLSPSGFVLPPLQADPAPLPVVGVGAKPDELNFGGQRNGWAGGGDAVGFKLLNDALRLINQLPSNFLAEVAWAKLSQKPYYVQALEPLTPVTAVTTDAVEVLLTEVTFDSTLNGPSTIGLRVSGVSSNGSALEQEFTFKALRQLSDALHMSPTGEGTQDPFTVSDLCYGNVAPVLMQSCVIRCQKGTNKIQVYVTGLASTSILWTCTAWRYRP